MSKISDNTVGRMFEMYAKYDGGESMVSISKEYGVSVQYVASIVRTVLTENMREKDLIAFAGDALEPLKKLPARSYHMMRRNGIHDVDSVRRLDRDTVISWRGCGDMITGEIMAFVAEIGRGEST